MSTPKLTEAQLARLTDLRNGFELHGTIADELVSLGLMWRSSESKRQGITDAGRAALRGDL